MRVSLLFLYQQNGTIIGIESVPKGISKLFEG